MKRVLLAEIFLVGITVAVLHKIALSLHFYWSVIWFDILMHFLGGALIALIALMFIYGSGFLNFSIKNKIVVFCAAVGTSFIIGLCWELWELYMGFSDVILDRQDTFIDLIMDILGATAAFLYSKNKICQKQD